MKPEEVEFWTFEYDNDGGGIIIRFNQNKKFINITKKDIKSMMQWIDLMEMEKKNVTY